MSLRLLVVVVVVVVGWRRSGVYESNVVSRARVMTAMRVTTMMDEATVVVVMKVLEVVLGEDVPYEVGSQMAARSGALFLAP